MGRTLDTVLLPRSHHSGCLLIALAAAAAAFSATATALSATAAALSAAIAAAALTTIAFTFTSATLAASSIASPTIVGAERLPGAKPFAEPLRSSLPSGCVRRHP